jgi:hypothetical protein
LLNMRLAYTGTWRPNVTWESDDGQWRFHVWFDPATLEPEQTFHKNPVDRSQVGVWRTESFRLTKRSNPELRAAVIATIGDGSALPELLEQAKEAKAERDAAERRENAAVFRKALAEGGMAIGRPEFVALAEQLTEDQLLALRQLR